MRSLILRSLLAVAVVPLGWSSTYGQVVGGRFDSHMQRSAMRDLVGPEGVCQERASKAWGTGEPVTIRSCIVKIPPVTIESRGSDFEMYVAVSWDDGSTMSDASAAIQRQGDVIASHGFPRHSIASCASEAWKKQVEQGGQGDVEVIENNLLLHCRAFRRELSLGLKRLAPKPKSDF